MKKILFLLLTGLIVLGPAVFAEGQQDNMKVSSYGKIAYQVSDSSELITGPAASGRVGDYILSNSSVSVLIGAPDNFHGYMKSGGNILDAATKAKSNDLFDEAHTYFSWPKQAIYEKIIIKDNGSRSGNGIIEVTGYKNDMPEIKINTTYTLSKDANYVVMRTTLINTSGKDVGPMILGDAVFFGYARSFLYGNGFSFKKFDSHFMAGVGDSIAYGVTTTQVDRNSGKLLPVHLAYIYADPEILPKAVIPAGQSVTFEREFIIAPTLAEVEKTVFDLRQVDYSVSSGKVVDTFGNTVPFAKVVIRDSSGLTVSESRTNAAGEYTFYLEKGKYSLSVEQPGYTADAMDLVAEKNMQIPDFKVGYVKSNSFVWPVYLTEVTKDSVYINLKTLLPSRVTVKYAKTADFAGSKKFTSSISENTAQIYHHIKLTGLNPNTMYTYAVISNDPITGTYEDKSSSFISAPTGGTLDNFSFVVYGDTRTFQKRNKIVCDAVLNDPADPRFVFNIGDLTMDGRVMEEWDQFFGAIGTLARQVPYYPILGNHEYNSSYYYEAFPLPKGGGTDQVEWYSFNYGSVHFTILDADVILMEKDAEKMQTQTKWLLEDLKANKDAKFKVVVFHQPFWTNVVKEKGNPELVEYWKSIFEKNGVNVVFNGHYHAYEHFSDNGIDYITTAGGGAPMYKLKEENEWAPYTKKSVEDIHHYTLVKVSGDTMTLTVKGVLKQTDHKKEDGVESYSGILDTITIKASR